MMGTLAHRTKTARKQASDYAALDRAGTREQQAFLAKCRKLAAKKQEPGKDAPR